MLSPIKAIFIKNLVRINPKFHQKFFTNSTFLYCCTPTSLSNGMFRPPPLVICGPSGVGKSTLLRHLFEEFGDVFGFSISHTSRKPRDGEKDGREYHFVTRAAMEEGIRNGEFIEHAEYSGNHYGTSKKAVEDVQSKGRICVLDIEIQGVKQIKLTDLNPRLVFVIPPSLDHLKDRLLKRGTETEESLEKRLEVAKKEIEYGEAEGNFDIVITNEELDSSYTKLKNFLIPDITRVRDHMKSAGDGPTTKSNGN